MIDRGIAGSRWLVVSALALAAACSAEEPSAVTEATYVGRADDEQTFVTLVRSGTSFLVYACDDTNDAWFRAESLVSPMELVNAAGDRVFVALDDDEAIGELTLAGSDAPIAFVLAPTQEDVLFRAESAIAGEPLLGGWIRLPDGEQRGVIRRATGRAASRIVATDGAVRVDGALAARLAPAAFQPAALSRPTVARPIRFDLYGLGDSYGAGEGAPEIHGDYRDDGRLEEGGDVEVWNASLTDEAEIREARACHRSGISGIELAADALGADYRGALDVRLETYACSGAQTEHFLDCPYRGAIGTHYDREQDFQQPQIARMAEASRVAGVDAVYMSIGGNDMGFGSLLAACIGDGSGPANECGPGSPVDTLFHEAVGRMEERYALVGAALAATGVPSEAVYLSQGPNPVVDEDGAPCDGLDLFQAGGIASIDAENVAWLARDIVPLLNVTVAAGAMDNEWTLVSEHVGRFVGHGYCSEDPWFVNNPESLRMQGRSMTDALNSGDFPRDMCVHHAETADNPGPVSPATVGGSIVHPNRDGYERGYAPAIVNAMRSRVEDHVRPLPVAALRTQAQRVNSSVTLAWDDRASTETEYRVAITYEEGRALPPSEVIVLPVDSREFSIPLSVRARGAASVMPCFVGPAPARREVCGEARTIRWTNFAPSIPPTGVAVDTTRNVVVPLRDFATTVPHQLVRVVYAASPEAGVVFYDVELSNVDGTTRRLATTESFFVATAQLATARVRACNFIGCSEPSLPVTGPACAAGQVVGRARSCVTGTIARSADPRDLQCPTLELDPAGICRR